MKELRPPGRVIVLGFDGMDYALTQSMLQQGLLPNIRSILTRGSLTPLPSVFPPDSIPAWITVFSGLPPAEHGVLSHFNYLLPDRDQPAVDTSVFHAKTFWDRIGKEARRKVCIVNPFMAYPVWPVNGVMISGPVFVKGEIQVSDPGIVSGLHVPDSLGGIDELPTRRNIVDFFRRTLDDTVAQGKFGLELFRRERPDFFFQTFYTTDRVQHHLWRYCDPSDPTYPGKSPVQDGIREFFAKIDEIVGEFRRTVAPEDLLVLMSDHGHGMRCTHCFNLNEYLRRRGHLQSAGERKRFGAKVMIEKLKNHVLKFMNDHDLEDYISTVARLVPGARKLKKGTHITDRSGSQAYATDFGGTNPFGGIKVNRECVEDYSVFRDQLIDELKGLENDGKPVFEWVGTRESIVSGKYIDRYPDILYRMRPQLGTGLAQHCELVTVNPTHKKISGGHRADGVFLCSDTTRWHVDPATCGIANIYATLLAIHGLDVEPGRGHSFLTPA